MKFERRWREVVALYAAGHSCDEIARAIGAADASTIAYVLRRHGVSARSRVEAGREYSCNESAFDVLTAESAYWIGFLMADGCVYYYTSPWRSPELAIRLGLVSRIGRRIKGLSKEESYDDHS